MNKKFKFYFFDKEKGLNKILLHAHILTWIDIFHIVQNTNEFSINLPRYFNSSVASHDFYLAGIMKNGITLNERDNYAYNVSYSDKLITDFTKPIVRYPTQTKNGLNPELSLEFKLNQPDIVTQFKSEFLFNLTDVVAIDNKLIGLCNQNYIMLYQYYKMGLHELNVTEYFQEPKNISNDPNDNSNEINKNKLNMEKRRIKKILIESTSNKNKNYILFFDYEDNIIIYKINSILVEKEGYLHSFTEVCIVADEKLKGKNIVDFIIKDETLFLGLESEGILILTKNNNKVYKVSNEIKKFKSEKNNTEINLDIKDIQQVNDCIYILIANYGLKILNIKDLNNIRFETFEFFHPYLEKIEIHTNPYYSNYFLGILISNRNLISGDEFFLEFNLSNEYSPYLNKIYLSDKVISAANILNDDYFTYIFEKNSNKFLVISRSSTANEYNSIFEIYSELFIGSSLISPAFIFSDEFKSSNNIGLITRNNFIYSKSVELSNSEMTFYFWEAGVYEVDLFTYSDYCSESTDTTKMCKVNLRYLFDVSMLPHDFDRIQNKSFFVIVGFFVFYNIICIVIYKIKYLSSSSFNKFNGDENQYNINNEISSSNRKGKDLGEQVIEMSA